MRKGNRRVLPAGFELNGKSRIYTIEKYISAGSNSIVYQAFYTDSLMSGHRHIVLIKELYPLDEKGRITRDEDWNLVVDPSADVFFQYHRNSFIAGNHAHLTLSEKGKGRIAENLDSFEANRTIYTVLTSKKGTVLSDLLEKSVEFPTVTDTAALVKNLLLALSAFHEQGLLHLDVSPDNLFILEAEGGSFPTNLILLDFNSVYSMQDGWAYENHYYFGKTGYMAPEIMLHREEEIGPWTDLYSVCALWYEILSGEKLPAHLELTGCGELISPYSRLLLHEKERTAVWLNRMLEKGLQILPKNRYQSAEEMLGDLKRLTDILSGIDRTPFYEETKLPQGGRKGKRRVLFATLACTVFLAAGLCAGIFLDRQIRSEETWEAEQSMEHTELDLTQFPLETDETVVLTEKNIRHPLEDNIMVMPVQSSMSVRINLKDYTHPRDTTEVFETYGIFCIYNGKGDKRGWQFADLTYDFFYTPDNVLHMELPFQDTNDFPLEYIGVIFANYNYTETSVLLDIRDCTLIDGSGIAHEITDLEGSHVLYFDEENWQWNLLSEQNLDFVEDFDDIYGGKLVVDAEVGFLDPILEVKWESDNPEVAEVDDKGRIYANRQGQATITATVVDKATGETRQTQMLVHVRSKLG